MISLICTISNGALPNDCIQFYSSHARYTILLSIPTLVAFNLDTITLVYQ